MYTDSCRTSEEGSYLVKFSDDAALLSLPQGPQSDNSSVLPAFVKWCIDHFLDLNMTKTKELIIDFKKNIDQPEFSIIHSKEVQIVSEYKHLGTVFDSQLKFDTNAESITNRRQQRIHLMGKLSSFGVFPEIFHSFYQILIGSLSTFIGWFNGLCVKDKKSFDSIVKVCSKIIGVQLKDLCSLWKIRVVQKEEGGIISQSGHVLTSE